MVRVLILLTVFVFSLEAEVKFFCGNVNVDLATDIADRLQIPLNQILVGRFNDGEIHVQVQESVRNCDVYVLQSTCPSSGASTNDNLMELYLITRALKRASAKSVTAVIPYFGYGRQDRKMEGRVPISASDVAMLLELAGVDHVISVDLHCGQIQGFFHESPVDNLFAAPVFVSAILREGLHSPVVISPDAGGVERAKYLVERLAVAGMSAGMAVIVKQRASAGVIDKMNLVGEVAGCDVIIIDDICDTAGTLVEAARQLKLRGARRVFACITHPLLSGPACSRISDSPIEKLFVTDTIPLRCTCPRNLVQLSIAPLMADALSRMMNGQSVSELFH